MTGTASPPGDTLPPAPACLPADQLSPWRHLPNLLTLSRLCLACFLFGLLSAAGPGWAPWLAALFLVAVLTDALDGFLARRYGWITSLGRVLDPFVDKVIVCGTLIFLLERPAETGVRAWMVGIVIGRELLITGLRSALEQQGKDFSAVWSGKLKMIAQSAAVTVCILSLDPAWFPPGGVAIRTALLYAMVALTAYSGWVYVVRAVQLWTPPP